MHQPLIKAVMHYEYEDTIEDLNCQMMRQRSRTTRSSIPGLTKRKPTKTWATWLRIRRITKFVVCFSSYQKWPFWTRFESLSAWYGWLFDFQAEFAVSQLSEEGAGGSIEEAVAFALDFRDRNVTRISNLSVAIDREDSISKTYNSTTFEEAKRMQVIFDCRAFSATVICDSFVFFGRQTFASPSICCRRVDIENWDLEFDRFWRGMPGI